MNKSFFFSFDYLTFFAQKKKKDPEAQNFKKIKNIKNSHATYDGVDMHPFETLFVKSSWHVGEPFVSAYSRWGARLASSSSSSSTATLDDGDGGDGEEEEGALSASPTFDAGTAGTFDEARYRYAISPEAQEDWGVAECFGKGAPPLPLERRKKRSKKGDDEGGWRSWWLT